jgi:hypothetical protein
VPFGKLGDRDWAGHAAVVNRVWIRLGSKRLPSQPIANRLHTPPVFTTPYHAYHLCMHIGVFQLHIHNCPVLDFQLDPRFQFFGPSFLYLAHNDMEASIVSKICTVCDYWHWSGRFSISFPHSWRQLLVSFL